MTPSGDADARQNAHTSEHPKDTFERPKSATGVLRECADPDLREINAAWPRLPGDLRRRLADIVRAFLEQPDDPIGQQQRIREALGQAHAVERALDRMLEPV